MLCFAVSVMTAWSATQSANGIPTTKGEHCVFTEGVRYSEIVINARLNDFKANSTAAGFGVYDATGHQTAAPTGTRTTLDYVPGLVAKAVIEAVDYYRGSNAVDVRPWYYAVQHYGNSQDISSNGKKGKSFDDLNAVKLYFKLRELAAANVFPDGEKYTNAQTVETAEARFADALKGISSANTTYVIKSSTLAGAAGGWWHKSGYTNQMWCDGQYMGPALLAQLRNEYKDYTPISDDDWALLVRQFTIAWHYLWNDDVQLLYHAFTADPANTSGWAGISAEQGAEVYHSEEYWGRAVAWYFLALVDVLEQMQQAGRATTADYATMHQMLQQLGEGIAAKQDAASGCWYQLLNHDGNFTLANYNSSYRYTAGPVANYLEASCTAIFIAAYLKGMRLGLFDTDYSDLAQRAYRGFVQQFMVADGNGGVHLIGSCKSAGLGGSSYRDGSAAYYLMGRDTEPTVDNPSSSSFYTEGKVLGGFIMAATEYERRFMDGGNNKPYGGGDGTKDNPYLISSAADLAQLASDVASTPNFSRGRYFKLTADIVINEGVNAVSQTALQKGDAFPQTEMIGRYAGENDYTPFQGIFDGDGHTISGFYAVPNANYVGLFRVLEGAEVRNLGLKDCFVYAGAYLSCLAGLVKDSRIINCYVVDSKIVGWGSNSGPLGGQIFGKSKIQNCYTAMSLSTKNDTGGIVGRIGNGTVEQVVVENCYTTSKITTSKSNKAGVTATNAEGSTVRNCYFTSASGANAVWPAQDKGTTTDCRQMTEEEMQAEEFLALLNSNSEAIPGACRWQKGDTTPIHNYNETTPEESKTEITAQATDPIPADGDAHADMDGDAPLLSWTAAADGKTTKQYIYFGTDSASIAQATTADPLAILGTETNYTLLFPLSTLHHYYWRVDREEADGRVTAGEVWSFRPRHLAFPGAEGYGRFARGGRGGKVVYVTNLSDSGEGSLRWALTNKQGPRTVMFKVSGIIDMNFQQCITDDNITIAAQSAPGKGICIKHSDIGVKSDCIVRFLRARRGLGTPAETGNAIGTTYANHTILDHVTASWGTDETFSSRGSQNITFQRSMISEALGIAGHRNYDPGTNHGYAATIGGDIGSFSHNLLANCNGRNWSMGGGTNANGEYAGRLDIFNNVVYNWNGRTTDGGAHEVNFVGNYYKMGADTRQTCLFIGQIEGNLKGTQSAYVSGNIRDNKNGTLSSDKLGDTYRYDIRDGRPSIDWEYFVSQPFFPSYANIETAQEAYKRVLSDVGANQPMTDDTDARIVSETLNRTHTYVGSKSGIKGEIDDEMDAGGFEDYPETAWDDSYDTDLDGLPDWWEEMRGLNAHSPADDFSDSNADSDGDGYTELEHYLDFLAQPHVILVPGEATTIDLKTLFAGYVNSPAFTAQTGSSSVTASIADGSMLTVKAGDTRTIATITMGVSDAEGATYERRFCVAVTDHAFTNVREVKWHSAATGSEAYDLSGRRIVDSCGLRPGIYILRGKKFAVK
jgi:rhamnogalacturonyl hydrolase YesR